MASCFYFYRLAYLETSAATGQNVGRAVETLLERVMTRMESAVDNALVPGRGGKSKNSDNEDLTATPPPCYC